MSSTKSGKAKGRRLQNWTADQIRKLTGFTKPDEIRPALMGEGGEDIKLSDAVRFEFPFQVECKNAEAISVWAAYKQAGEHGPHEPLLIIKKNNHKPLAVMDAEMFIAFVGDKHDFGK
jgi:hypothetical protein|tara:strand:+ start:277 stop:630 length:354 start_codon:yes stop_codon:yes gene_type:complete